MDLVSTLHCLYRMSTNGYPKEKFSFATKQYCLRNFLREFGPENVVVLMDQTNLDPQVFEEVQIMQNQGQFDRLVLYEGGSSAASFRASVEYLLHGGNPQFFARTGEVDTRFKDDDFILLQEDDYLYRAGSKTILLEGLEKADYVSLYLHGDRFVPKSQGGNPFVDDTGAFVGRVCKTDSSFWVQVESTTMTFATSLKTLKEDIKIWEPYINGKHPNDFGAFVELSVKAKRSLITPIPGYATHCEPKWASPLFDWSTV